MNLYDRVLASMKLVSKLPPRGNVSPEGDSNPQNVPTVTYTREKDKNIFPFSTIGNGKFPTIYTSRARVTTGTIYSDYEKGPQHAIPSEWDGPTLELIAWFKAASRLTTPFHLIPHIHVCDPRKFYEALEDDIEAGPEGPRMRYSTLIGDLKQLRSIMEKAS